LSGNLFVLRALELRTCQLSYSKRYANNVRYAIGPTYLLYTADQALV